MYNKNMKRIKLTQGKYALVDDADFDWLDQWKWQYDSNGYAKRSQYLGPHPTKKDQDLKARVYMHRLVIKATEGMITDHINRDKLDNRRSNLRLCTESENKMNVTQRTDNKSGYKGVTWHKQGKKWEVYISINKKKIHLGLFSNIFEAARRYNIEATKYYGEYAKLNNIIEKEKTLCL